jgi:hypothetical protein
MFAPSTLVRWLTFLWPLLTIAPLLSHAGVPAFQHDWLWPVDRVQLPNYVAIGFESWERNGLGYAQVYPAAWWAYLTVAMTCWIAGPHGGLVIFLYAALSVGAGGSARLARELGSSGLAEAIAILIYVSNPFVLNEVQAGHLFMLWSYALLPWIAALAIRPPTALRSAQVGVLIGLASAQQQFLIFGIIVASVCTLCAWPRRFPYMIVTGVCAAAFSMPLWLPSVTAHSTDALNVLAPTHDWQLAQSASPADALRLIGYIGLYDRRLGAVVEVLLWFVPFLAVLGLLRARIKHAAWGFLFLAAIGITLASGLGGPLASSLDYGFAHIRALTLLRELYDATALTALAYAALGSIAFGTLSRPYAARAGAVGAAALAVVCLAVSWHVARDLPWYDPPSQFRAQLRTIAAMPGNARVLPIPLNPPLSMSSAKGGLSPLQIGIGDHATAAFVFALSPSTYAAKMYAQSGGRRGEELLERMQIGTVVRLPIVHPSFETGLDPKIRLHGLPPELVDSMPKPFAAGPPNVPRAVVLPYSAVPGSLASSYTGARDIAAMSGGTPIDLFARSTQPDPSRGWARTPFWPILPSWAFAEPLAIFTMRRVTALDVPRSLVVAGDGSGRLRGTGCLLIRRLDSHFSLFRCASRPVLDGDPPIVISQASIDARAAYDRASSGAVGAVRVEVDRPDYLRLRVHAVAGSALVLRDSFDDGWAISIPGTDHVTVDGYANGWVFRRTVDSDVELSYRPARLYFAALALSIAMALAAIIVTVLQTLGASKAGAGSLFRRRLVEVS